MPIAGPDVFRNHILVGLPEQERRLVLPLCDMAALHVGDVTCETEGPIEHIDFPLDTARISVFTAEALQNLVEVTVIGREGCSGSSVVQGGDCPAMTSIVDARGAAVRVTASALREHLPRTPYLRAAMERHHALVAQHVAVALTCQRSHSAAQRLGKWLVLYAERTQLDTFPITSSLLATKGRSGGR